MCTSCVDDPSSGVAKDTKIVGMRTMAPEHMPGHCTPAFGLVLTECAPRVWFGNAFNEHPVPNCDGPEGGGTAMPHYASTTSASPMVSAFPSPYLSDVYHVAVPNNP